MCKMKGVVLSGVLGTFLTQEFPSLASVLYKQTAGFLPRATLRDRQMGIATCPLAPLG